MPTLPVRSRTATSSASERAALPCREQALARPLRLGAARGSCSRAAGIVRSPPSAAGQGLPRRRGEPQGGEAREGRGLRVDLDEAGAVPERQLDEARPPGRRSPRCRRRRRRRTRPRPRSRAPGPRCRQRLAEPDDGRAEQAAAGTARGGALRATRRRPPPIARRRPQASQRAQASVPWSSSGSALPARWWRPSTFWVTRQKDGNRRSHLHERQVGRVGRGRRGPRGSAPRTTARPAPDRAENASGVAISSGRTCCQTRRVAEGVEPALLRHPGPDRTTARSPAAAGRPSSVVDPCSRVALSRTLPLQLPAMPSLPTNFGLLEGPLLRLRAQPRRGAAGAVRAHHHLRQGHRRRSGGDHPRLPGHGAVRRGAGGRALRAGDRDPAAVPARGLRHGARRWRRSRPRRRRHFALRQVPGHPRRRAQPVAGAGRGRRARSTAASGWCSSTPTPTCGRSSRAPRSATPAS